MKNVNFDLKQELGMKIASDTTVGNVYGQAEKLSVKKGWKVFSIASGIDEPIKVSNGKHIAEVLKQFCDRGCTRCVISFVIPEECSRNVDADETPLSPNVKSGAVMAAIWFVLKVLAGSTANEWLSSILAFSVCGVVSVFMISRNK